MGMRGSSNNLASERPMSVQPRPDFHPPSPTGTCENLTAQKFTPFNAMVQFENVEIGQVVFPQSLVAKLVGADSYWVVADGNDSTCHASKRAVHLHPKSPLSRPVESLQNFEGRVLRLLTHVEPRARMAQLVVEVLDPRTRERILGTSLGQP